MGRTRTEKSRKIKYGLYGLIYGNWRDSYMARKRRNNNSGGVGSSDVDNGRSKLPEVAEELAERSEATRIKTLLRKRKGLRKYRS